MAAYGQPRPQAASDLRTYFTAHPNEYYDLRGVLAPIGDTERQCNVTALPLEPGVGLSGIHGRLMLVLNGPSPSKGGPFLVRTQLIWSLADRRNWMR